MSRLLLSAAEFSILTTLVEERIGLSYGLADKSMFESKLTVRLEEAGYESALDYYYYLRYDDPDGSEFRALAQVLTVHETYFFREIGPLRAAIECILEPRRDEGQRVRVWCAACSTGEEPLSFAMLAASMGRLHSVEIIATDLSPNALRRARSGSFGPRSLRGAMPAWASPYLLPRGNGYEVAPEIMDAVAWRELNLLDRDAVESLGELDLVLCRNVLIYFREGTARDVVQTIAARIKPRGAMLVGVSESLMRLTTGLQCEEHAGSFIYRKAASP